MSRNRLIVCLVLASLLLPVALGGTQEDPELSDPAGDAEATATCTTVPEALCGPLIEGFSASGAADLISVWVTEPDNARFTIHFGTAAAGDDGTELAFNFTIVPTDSSFHNGSADPIPVAATVTGTTAPTAPANTTVVRNGTVLEVTFTRRDTGAVGGDSIQSLSASATHVQNEDGPPGHTITTTDSTSGPSRPYDLTRPPIVPDIDLIFVETTVQEDGQTRTSGQNEVLLTTADATVTFDLVLSNAGTDPDTAGIEVFDPTGSLAADGVVVAVSPANVGELLPGETADVTVTAQLTDATPGEHAILLQATSGRGAIAATAMQVTVPAPPAPTPTTTAGPTPTPTQGPADEDEREAAFGLDFLTPLATALGLDGPFGEYAELVLLGIILLLLVLAVFLIVFLATRGAVAVSIEPSTLSARPGETAEFSVEVRNKRGRPMDAVTHFEGDPSWRTGLAFGDAKLTQAHADARLGLGPKDLDSGTRLGKLMVTVPRQAHQDESDRVTVAVSALNDAGRPVKTRSATVRVRAEGGAVKHGGDLPMRLASVTHMPEEPAAGETVATTARLENDSDSETLELRVVLNVDGDDLEEQSVNVPPRSARAVVFRWEAPQGSSKVKVRVYPQE